MSLFIPMYIGFSLVLFFLYYLVSDRYRMLLIFLASSVFIASLSLNSLLYIYLYITINYIIGLLLNRPNQQPVTKKIIFNIGIFLNIGSLVFFKYINFFLSFFVHLFNIYLDIPDIVIKVFLPIGISYFTFQGIGYLLQMYRGNEKMEKNLLIFSNYFIFFPKFVSGPIERSKTFLPQLRSTYQFNYTVVVEGFRLILWGVFKKMVIADRLVMVIDSVYPQLHTLSGNSLIITFLLQPLHVYFDFSGYTDIALGLGRVFGFKLTDNFRRPFFSVGVTEFWRRWHISLSSWCSEFIFMRLLFKKKNWGLWASVYAVFITFLVIGIWHGPRWTFIVLGILQGVAINYEFFTRKVRGRIAKKLPTKTVLYASYLFTYLFVGLSMVFFYSPNLKDAFYFLSHLFVNIDFENLNFIFLSTSNKYFLLFTVLFVMTIEFRQENGKDFFKEILLWKKWQRYTFYYLLLFLVIYFGSPVKAFVYMQF